MAVKLLEKSNSKYNIVLNPFAASKHRSFPFSKLQSLISLLEKQFNCSIFVIGHKNNKLYSLENDRTFICLFDNILESASLIKYSDVIITPDTSIVHIASAFNKKTVALYLDYSKVFEKINIIWAPNNKNSISVSLDTGNGLKGDVKDIPDVDIIRAVEKLL
jgi:heptosyltransferase-4